MGIKPLLEAMMTQFCGDACANRGGVYLKALFVNFSVGKIFNLAKVPVRFFESHSYLTGCTTAELWLHLPNINMIFNS